MNVKLFLNVMMLFIFFVSGFLTAYTFVKAGKIPIDTFDKELEVYSFNDIAYCDFSKKKIQFEDSDKELSFDSHNEMFDYIGEYTLKNSMITSYKEDIEWLVNNGYITAHIVTPDEGKEWTVGLHYLGPNWTVNAQQDTAFSIATFYLSKLYKKEDSTKYIYFYNK